MLFDKNGFYTPALGLDNYDFAIDIMTGSASTSDNKFYEPTEALRLGNTFPNLYKPYKNYEPSSLKASTEREKCLLEIQKLDFVITDLNLYLDMHPEDEYAYRMFTRYVEDCKKKKDEYTRIFGPLVLEDLTENYEWSKGVWPWEEGGM